MFILAKEVLKWSETVKYDVSYFLQWLQLYTWNIVDKKINIKIKQRHRKQNPSVTIRVKDVFRVRAAFNA